MKQVQMIFLLVCLAGWGQIRGQEDNMFIPQEIFFAYEEGTRGMDGRPGAEYWINQASYRIQAFFDPVAGSLKGHETILYQNNSPDNLGQIVIRLYQDLYRKGGIRDRQLSGDLIHDGVKISLVRINGKEVSLENPANSYSPWQRSISRSGTNMIVPLSSPLASGQQLEMEIEWEETFPRAFMERMGAYGPRTWFVGYWYPQIAVYDDIDGWDTDNYTPTQEMYNDFHDFEVEITVPGDVLVWGTGWLENEKEILDPQYVSRLETARTSDSLVTIAGVEDLRRRAVTQKAETHTWKFSAEHVPDFAFSVSDSLIWEASSMEVEPGRRVSVQVAYDKEARYYEECLGIALKSLEELSSQSPGIPFPYPAITIFQGDMTGGGMEFPMMCNNGRVRDRADLIDLTYHEIAHTYLPFYSGINERKYSWMDEGLVNIMPNEMVYREEPKNGDPMLANSISYSRIAGSELDLPLITLSKYIYGWPYYTHTYFKPSCAFHILKDYLGNDLYQKALKEFLIRWEGKHPLPYDFFFTFNDVTGRDLSWFWKPWFQEFGFPDLGIGEVSIKGKTAKITVEKKGNLPLPVHIVLIYRDGKQQEHHITADIWADGRKETTVKLKTKGEISEIQIGRTDIPDINMENQGWKKD